jgi:hypothetical protein
VFCCATLQVDVLSRQAALAEVLQHRIADQEDVLQQLQNELEHVDAQRVSWENRASQHVVGCACACVFIWWVSLNWARAAAAAERAGARGRAAGESQGGSSSSSALQHVVVGACACVFICRGSLNRDVWQQLQNELEHVDAQRVSLLGGVIAD